MRPRASYSNRAINVAVASVVEDKMPVGAVVRRMARAFALKVSENAIRTWVSQAANSVRSNLESEETQLKILEDFSGVLCVDEAYSGKLAILFATDPNHNDRLIGYVVKEASFSQGDVETFLASLKEQGIVPDQVVTDESALYPGVIKRIWPNVKHQLCLFHVGRKLTDAAKSAIRDLRLQLPTKPKDIRNPSRKNPGKVAAAIQMRSHGLGFKAIALVLGVSKNSVKKWVREPTFIKERYGVTSDSLYELVEKENLMYKPNALAPPKGWKSWKQVEDVRHQLNKMVFGISVKSFSKERSEIYANLLKTPVGSVVAEIRNAVEAWHRIWSDANREAELRSYWDYFRNLPIHERYKPFSRFRRKMTDELFEALTYACDNNKFERTNNSAERYARRFKKIQKSRYRIRSKTAAEDHLLLDSLMSRNPLQYEDLAKSAPYT